MLRLFWALTTAVLLSACTNANDLDEAPVYLGNFSLGHNVAVAPNLTKGPASRDATEEEWVAAMKDAIDERFSRYDGEKLYHIGISIEGYVLAIPGVPVVASPKSALIIRVTAWDDAAGQKLNEAPKQITVVEDISTNTIFGSGFTQSKDVQMKNLARNAAKLIQNWLVRENARNGWFEPDGQISEAAVSAEAELESETAPDLGDIQSSEEDTQEPETVSDPDSTSNTASPTSEESAEELSENIVEPSVASGEDVEG